MDTTLLIWNRVVSWTGIFTSIISDIDPEFTPALWKNLHQLFGTRLSFSTAYHPQTGGLAERMIQTLEDMVKRFSLELAYKTSIHANPNQTSAISEKVWNPKLPQDSLWLQLFEIHPTAYSFKEMLEKAGRHAVRCMGDFFAYSKNKWDKSHATPDFKVWSLVILSMTNFNNLKGCKTLKGSFAGPFFIKALHGENAVEVDLFEELRNKHSTFPVSLIKQYKSSDAEKFPLRNKVPQVISPLESSGIQKITKVLKEGKLRTNKVREYLNLLNFSEGSDTLGITILQSNIPF
ncbi:hypothetical protein O181_131892 [Austropuccinia psidii MF-1]|uniref:Integrase catalytic domain-containing protein n=1 Tax=Austropuccinia psidii MF-1 TaxID=1389203 RepID=A0A9Q3QDK9_9BASI|nr:hypothetical protein [Austropuccinia psidii MF-1]